MPECYPLNSCGYKINRASMIHTPLSEVGEPRVSPCNCVKLTFNSCDFPVADIYKWRNSSRQGLSWVVRLNSPQAPSKGCCSYPRRLSTCHTRVLPARDMRDFWIPNKDVCEWQSKRDSCLNLYPHAFSGWSAGMTALYTPWVYECVTWVNNLSRKQQATTLFMPTSKTLDASIKKVLYAFKPLPEWFDNIKEL